MKHTRNRCFRIFIHDKEARDQANLGRKIIRCEICLICDLGQLVLIWGRAEGEAVGVLV